MKTIFRIISLHLCILLSGQVNAEPEWVIGNVQAVMNDTQYFGKCMAYSYEFTPSNGCPSGWVSLDCEGNFLSKVDARRMYEGAQLALAISKPVAVLVDDSKRINGYCVAIRLDNRVR